MKYLPLVLSGLLRSPARTTITALSIFTAFLLFGVLQGIDESFDAAIAEQRLDRLLTDPRVPGGAPMPLSAMQKIEAVPGVVAVAHRAIFVGYYQERRNGMFALATDPDRWFAVRPEFEMPEQQRAALRSTRTGLAVTPNYLAQFGWKVGDKIPIQSPIQKKDGSNVWTFDLVGVIDDPSAPGQGNVALINYEYFDEARAHLNGTADRFIVRIDDPMRSASVALAIDGTFTNSASETRTQNEQEATQAQLQQMGDMKFLTNAISAAVLFTLLFVTGNAMMQSVRERTPELATLRALGYPEATVLQLILAEAAALCGLGAMLGICASVAVFPLMGKVFGFSTLPGQVFVTGLVCASAMALASATIPVLQMRGLRIPDALRRR